MSTRSLHDHTLIITTPATFTDSLILPPHICRRYLMEHAVYVCFAVTTFTDAQCHKCGTADPLILAYWPDDLDWRGIYCGRCDAVSHKTDEVVIAYDRYRVVFDYGYNLLALETRVHILELITRQSYNDTFCSCCRSTCTDRILCDECYAYLTHLLLVHQTLLWTCRLHYVPPEVATQMMHTYLQILS